MITYNRSSTLRRILTWTIGFLQTFWLLKTRFRDAELFLVSNPPLNVFLPLLTKNPFKILVYDIYPDAFADMQVIRPSSKIYKYWSRVNRKVFAQAKVVFTIGLGLRSRIAQYVAEDKVKVIPIWTDNEFLKPVKKDENPFILQHQLKDKFILLYSGNIGRTHRLGLLTEIAERLKATNLHVLIIGEGEQKQELMDQCRVKQLDNVTFLPWQSVDVLPFSLAAADVGVVSLGREASLLSVPSKTYNLLSVGVPLCCVCDPTSELATLVSQHELGACFQESEVDKIEKFIQKLMCEDTSFYDRFAANSLSASHEFTPENAKQFL